MTTLGDINTKTGTFKVYMTCLDHHFIDTVKATIPVSDREWHSKENEWIFALRHLETIKRILEFPRKDI